MTEPSVVDIAKPMEVVQTVKEALGFVGNHVPEAEIQDDSNPTGCVMGGDCPKPLAEDLHENRKVKKAMEKSKEKETKLGKSSKEKPAAKPDLKESMQVELDTSHEAQKAKVSCKTTNNSDKVKEDGPNYENIQSGPIAMSFDEKEGWISESLGPNSRHWKRLAREVHVQAARVGGNPINGKREGLIPLQELDPNISELKCRRSNKGNNQNQCGEEKRDGSVAVVAEQHRRAS